MSFKVIVDKERCKGCEYCIEACLQSVLKMSKVLNLKGNHFPESVLPEACTGCRRCVSMCPDTAIRIAKAKHRLAHPAHKEKK